jgi:hypothetical protein
MAGEKTNKGLVNPTLTVAATANEARPYAPRALSEDKPRQQPLRPSGV